MWDKNGKKYLDLISGFSVMNMGHSNPVVIDAITKQINQYMHLMVYGEFNQGPQVEYSSKIAKLLPSPLDCIYFTTGGSEAVEAALKLAKRTTGRTELISFKNAVVENSMVAC